MINNLFFKKNSTPVLILGFSNIPFEVYALEVSILYFRTSWDRGLAATPRKGGSVGAVT